MGNQKQFLQALTYRLVQGQPSSPGLFKEDFKDKNAFKKKKLT